MENKICPLLMAGNRPDMGISCRGEYCAWYTRGRCAVADIADTAVSIAMDTDVLGCDE